MPVDAVALRRVAGMVKGALHRREGRMVERVGNGRDVRWRVVRLTILVQANPGTGPVVLTSAVSLNIAAS